MELYTKDRNHTVISLPFYLFLSKDFNTNHEEARKKGPLIAQIAAPIATIYRIKNWQSEMANNCKIKDWAE